MAKNFNKESIIKQFELVDGSLHRARLPFDTDMLHPENIEVVLWELIKAKEQLINMIREIAPDRFGITVQRYIHIPDITTDRLFLCNICGSPNCESDHK